MFKLYFRAHVQKTWPVQKAVEGKPRIYSAYHSFQTWFVSNMSKYVLRWSCSGKKHDLMLILLSILTIVSYTEKRRKHSGVSELEKVPFSNIQDNQFDLPSTCFPLWKYQSHGKWPTLPTALWWEGNLRATYHIIDMSLFGWLASLKSFKEMRNPGGPRERHLAKMP